VSIPTCYDRTVKLLDGALTDPFNISAAVCDSVEEEFLDQVALIVAHCDLEEERYSFREVRDWSSRLASIMQEDGQASGAPVAVCLDNSFEAAIAHLAIMKIGMISVPILASDPDQIVLRKLAITLPTALFVSSRRGLDWQSIPSIRRAYDLEYIDREMIVNGRRTNHISDAAGCHPPPTVRGSVAAFAFTSGTGSFPKAAIQAHQFLLGTLPSVDVALNSPSAGQLLFAPFDWGWLSGLAILFSAWFFRMPFLVLRGLNGDPSALMDQLMRFEVEHAAFVPTTLRILRTTVKSDCKLRLKSMTTGGERVPSELHEWASEIFHIRINEMYGMTECPGVIGTGDNWQAPVGAMGRAIPGHNLCLIDQAGRPVKDGDRGIIGIRKDHPGVFLGYLNEPTLTRSKFSEEWLISGDIAVQDERGFFWYEGRSDEVIVSAGTRVSLHRIEKLASTHSSVALALAVSLPDDITGEKVILFVVPTPGRLESDLVPSVRGLLRANLSPFEIPRHIRVVDDLPKTATGKLSRVEMRNRYVKEAE